MTFATHIRAANWSIRNELAPSAFPKWSKEKAWFDCDKCTHSFETSLASVSGGSWCPYCANLKRCEQVDCQMCFHNSFASHEKAVCWSSSNTFMPRDIAKYAKTKVIFECDICCHEFSSTVNDVSAGKWCPYCANLKRCEIEECEMCFDNSFASHSKSSCWSNSNVERPRDIALHDNRNYIFKCDVCCHEFSSTVNDVSAGKWCPYCANLKRCEIEECEMCFENSFASHPRSSCWSNLNEDKPRNVARNSEYKYIFICDICSHDFISTPCEINRGRWCPYCVNLKRCDLEGCDMCFKNSFASHPKSKCWSASNTEDPKYVAKTANRKFIFDCDICYHEFEIALGHISEGKWCPFCANHRRCDKQNCAMCFKNSFASHPKAQFWAPSNSDRPRDVAINNNKKYIFQCDMCYEYFETSPHSVNNGTWCPWCKKKTECLVNSWLLEWYGEQNIETQFKLDKCFNPETKRLLPFDFVIKSIKVIIEVDGRQHFSQVQNWRCPDLTCQIDVFKMHMALDAGFKIIRICQEDVWNNQDHWKYKLKTTLNSIFENSQVQYLSRQKNLYEKHANTLNNFTLENIRLMFISRE